MSSKERLKQLEHAQELVVLESDIHRRLIGVEFAALRSRSGWLTSAAGAVPRTRRWWMPAAVVAGVLVARNWGKALRWLPLAFSGYRFVRKFWPG